METLQIQPTDDTPGVYLSQDENKFEFTGKSLPEDVVAFYGPILKWLEDYSNTPNSSTVVEFKMDYFNTASSKMILDVLLKLEELSNAGHHAKVMWLCRDGDEDMEEAGEELDDIVDVEFELGVFH